MSIGWYKPVGRKAGRAHHRAKLPTESVTAMRHQRKRYGKSYRQLATEFNCSKWTVRDICEYRTRVSS